MRITRYLRAALPEPSSTRDPWRDSPVVRATEGGRGRRSRERTGRDSGETGRETEIERREGGEAGG